jgi:hypothetical protein
MVKIQPRYFNYYCYEGVGEMLVGKHTKAQIRHRSFTALHICAG